MTKIEHACLGLRFLRLDHQARLIELYPDNRIRLLSSADAAVGGYWELALQLQLWHLADAAEAVRGLIGAAIIEAIRGPECRERLFDAG